MGMCCVVYIHYVHVRVHVRVHVYNSVVNCVCIHTCIHVHYVLVQQRTCIIHGKSCAQRVSTEETTHSTTHVQPHKITKINK